MSSQSDQITRLETVVKMYRAVMLLAGLTIVNGFDFLDGDIEIMNGISLVSVNIPKDLEDETGRSFGENSVVFKIAKFLQGHELRVRLPNLVEKDKLTYLMDESLKTFDESSKNGVAIGRGHHNHGGGMSMLGMMFAKTIGAMGLGAVALMTMKALALSAAALLLAALVAAKKMHSHDDHEDHQVIYAGHGHHHRRKRDIPIDTPLPYRGWAKPEN